MEYDLNRQALYWLFDDSRGPSGQYLKEKADETADNMKELILSSPPDGGEYTYYIFTPYPGRRAIRQAGSGPASGDQERDFPHTASAAGDAPRNWMGDLIASIYVTPVSQMRAVDVNPDSANAGQFAGMTVRVEVGVSYAIYLEKGWSVGQTGAEPRPFMEPALDMTFGAGAGANILRNAS